MWLSTLIIKFTLFIILYILVIYMTIQRRWTEAASKFYKELTSINQLLMYYIIQVVCVYDRQFFLRTNTLFLQHEKVKDFLQILFFTTKPIKTAASRHIICENRKNFLSKISQCIREALWLIFMLGRTICHILIY